MQRACWSWGLTSLLCELSLGKATVPDAPRADSAGFLSLTATQKGFTNFSRFSWSKELCNNRIVQIILADMSCVGISARENFSLSLLFIFSSSQHNASSVLSDSPHPEIIPARSHSYVPEHHHKIKFLSSYIYMGSPSPILYSPGTGSWNKDDFSKHRHTSALLKVIYRYIKYGNCWVAFPHTTEKHVFPPYIS